MIGLKALAISSANICTVSLLALASAAHAQEVSAPQSANETTVNEDGTIIVTARLRNERLIDVPLAVTVTTAEQLGRDQIYSLTDL
ncbi:hypothetical protein IP81_18185, partial [Novosphingobium sp. AAP83]